MTGIALELDPLIFSGMTSSSIHLNSLSKWVKIIFVIYWNALDLRRTNLVFIFLCDKPLPVWPPFCFFTKMVKIDRKIYIIRPIMTEYVLFAFATCVYVK